MSFNFKILFAVLIIAAAFSAAAVRAADKGQEDLDKATELKLSATTVTDWGEVIRLTETRSKKGLISRTPSSPIDSWPPPWRSGRW